MFLIVFGGFIWFEDIIQGSESQGRSQPWRSMNTGIATKRFLIHIERHFTISILEDTGCIILSD